LPFVGTALLCYTRIQPAAVWRSPSTRDRRALLLVIVLAVLCGI
jgi:nitrate reductase gamma subunit